MTLYQFLRFFQSGKAIIIFDIAGVCICSVATKEDIPSDLYGYDLLNIDLGIINKFMSQRACQYITIQK